MPLPDYYATLQVDPQADQEIVAAAYRRLAAKYHPDVNHTRGAAERMRIINEAYKILGDPERRQHYDALLSEGFGERAVGSRLNLPTAPVVCAGCRSRFERGLRSRDVYTCPFCRERYVTLRGTVQTCSFRVVEGLLASKAVFQVLIAYPEGNQLVRFETSRTRMVQLRERDGVLFHFNRKKKLILIQNLSLRQMCAL